MSENPPCEIEVVLDGATHAVHAAPGQTVLEAAEAAGLSPPYSCREGSCATCMCTLEAGAVSLKENNVLSAADLADGWILGCQALASTPQLRVRWPD